MVVGTRRFPRVRTAPAPKDPGDGHARQQRSRLTPRRLRRLLREGSRLRGAGGCARMVAVKYFPVFFDLKGLRVLVVGGGEVALRKVSLLEQAGAVITVVAPRIAPELKARAAAGTIKLVSREFLPEDLDGARLVIVATSRRAVNRFIAKLSDARAIPVNVVDDGDASRFIVPAIVDRDPVMVAVSTGGTSPVLARRLRERLEAFLPKRLGDLAMWLRGL